jgi:hypothetical protein
VHLTIHRVHSVPPAGPRVSIDDRDIPTLLLTAAELAPLLVTFDSVATALETVPRLYFEPDGSFVWVGFYSGDHTPWELNGQLHDRGQTLNYVELKGSCHPERLAILLNALRTSEELLVFYLVPAGVFVDEPTALALLEC